MKILVTGAKGQLGRELTPLLEAAGYETLGVDRKEMDIASPEACSAVIQGFRPDAVIHAAAYTAVDQAESDVEQAYRINALGSRNVAWAAALAGAKCCAVSTDYVFDGTAHQPYREFDPPNPITVYGKTKLAGEQLAIAMNPRTFIVRTAWLYGRHGGNFVGTMLKLGAKQQPLQVVNDQWGSPTSAADLAGFLVRLIATDLYGVYHAANGGVCTWHDLAQAVFEEAGMTVDLAPCTTAEFPRPAPRPRYSALDCLAIRANGLQPLRHWREGLKDYLTQIKPE